MRVAVLMIVVVVAMLVMDVGMVMTVRGVVMCAMIMRTVSVFIVIVLAVIM
jgi:hypothetical protein